MLTTTYNNPLHNMPTANCCVCLEDTKQYITCDPKHPVCLTCLPQMLEKCCQSRYCGSMMYRCPLCRSYVKLDVPMALCIGFGSTQILDKVKCKSYI